MGGLIQGSLPQPKVRKIPNRNHIASVFGHSPPQLGLSYEGNQPTDQFYRERIKTTLWEYQIDILKTGLNMGIDQLAAEAALELGIEVEAYIPGTQLQELTWQEECRDRYYNLLTQSTEVFKTYGYSGEEPESNERMQRDRLMIEGSQYVLIYWDGTPGRTRTAVRMAQAQPFTELIYCIIPHGQPVLECDAERS